MKFETKETILATPIRTVWLGGHASTLHRHCFQIVTIHNCDYLDSPRCILSLCSDSERMVLPEARVEHLTLYWVNLCPAKQAGFACFCNKQPQHKDRKALLSFFEIWSHRSSAFTIYTWLLIHPKATADVRLHSRTYKSIRITHNLIRQNSFAIGPTTTFKHFKYSRCVSLQAIT